MNSRHLPIFLMHVPKSAGLSVLSVLSTSFNADEICPHPVDGKWGWRAEDVPGYLVYSGHFTVDFLNDMGPQGTRLIVMRHPVSRAVSLYDYWRSYRWEHIRSNFLPYPDSGPAVAKSVTFTQFLDEPFAADNIYNHCARLLLGRKFDELFPDEDAMIEHAVRSLRGFAWVGLTEMFEQSIAQLTSLLDIPMPASLPKENSTYDQGAYHPAFEPVVKLVPSEAERERLVTGNRVDMAIYEEGRTLLEQRVRS